MADETPKKVKLYRETWRAMKDSVSVWWPWVIVFSALIAATEFLLGHPIPKFDPELIKQFQQNPDLIKHPTAEFLQQHPEFAKDPPGIAVARMTGGLVIQ